MACNSPFGMSSDTRSSASTPGNRTETPRMERRGEDEVIKINAGWVEPCEAHQQRTSVPGGPHFVRPTLRPKSPSSKLVHGDRQDHHDADDDSLVQRRFDLDD